MMRIKHTTNINDITIFVSAHIITGNALVASVFQLHDSIQFHTIGKHVFNAIHLHSSLGTQSAALT